MAGSVIGSDVERVDGTRKVRGEGLYGGDRNPERMAYALPVLATIGKGRVRKIDTSRAERVPDVVLVLTHLNMDRLQPLRFIFAGGHGSQSLQPMQSDAVAYRGQVIALIVANSLEAAHAASPLVTVEYEEVPFSIELESPGREEVVQAVAAPYFPDFVAGHADEVFASSPVQIDETYWTPTQHHNPMELLTSVAEWRGETLVVHEGTQFAQALARGLAVQLGIEPAKIRVVGTYAGGGFGQRNSIAPHTVLAAVAARRLRRPVKIALTREQCFYGVHFRPAAEHRVRLGADRSGRILAATHEVRAQTSRFDLFPFTGAETTSRMYGIASFRSSVTLVKLDTQTPGFMRAPFEMGSAVALEGAVDELAYKLGRDPVELRIANDAQVDPITGKPFTSRRLNECLRRGAERFGWARRTAQPMSMRDADGTLIGWGVAAGGYPAYIAPSLAIVRLNAEGTIDVSVGGHEMGQGVRTAIALVVAEELGVEPQKVQITIGDTIAPPQHLTAGSWGTATATPAVAEAARSVRAQLVKLATSLVESPLRSVDAAAIVLRDGRVSSADGTGMPFGELLRRGGVSELVGRKEWFAPGQTSESLQRADQGVAAMSGPDFPGFVAFSYAAHFAEVRVHPRIPRPRVARMVSVVDCGRVVSRRTARSQMTGGIVWGVGAALAEETELDPRFGGFLNSNIAEYQVPVNADIGALEVDFIDEPDFNFNPVGAKGLGEVATVGAAAAIANAVFHATGRRVRDMPIRIEDLL